MKEVSTGLKKSIKLRRYLKKGENIFYRGEKGNAYASMPVRREERREKAVRRAWR